MDLKNKNNAETMNKQGMDFINKYKDISKNTKNGIELLNKSIKLGSGYAMYELGRVYLEGKGVPYNKERGKELIKQAAEHGNLKAIKEILQRMNYIQNSCPYDNYPEVNKEGYIEYLKNLVERKEETKDRVAFACLLLMHAYI
jgi:TPR repeat protein